jgi:hypothetical protein
LSTKFSAEGFEADQRWMWLYTTSDRRSPDVGELRDRFQFEDGVDFGFEYSTAAVEQQSEAGLAVGTLLASVLGFAHTDRYSRLLFVVSKETWHHLHEDIVLEVDMELKLRSPEACDFFYEMALFVPHPGFDVYRALCRKAMFGLGNIHSELSEQRIRELALSDDELVREYAFEQIYRHDIQGIERIVDPEWDFLDEYK